MNYPTLNETERLSFLENLHFAKPLDRLVFDRVVDAARRIFSVPYALINFIGRDKVCIRAGILGETEIAREDAFCNYTILHDTVMVVPDAHDSPSFSDNPFVQGEPYVRFYAGAPLIVAPGVRIGSLCIIDTKPRSFDPRQAQTLAGLARLVVDELWLQQTLHGIGHGLSVATVDESSEMDLSARVPLSGAQIRAARALLDWSIARLSVESGISVNTIKRFEARDEIGDIRSCSPDTLRTTLEHQGIIFLGVNGVARKPDVS